MRVCDRCRNLTTKTVNHWCLMRRNLEAEESQPNGRSPSPLWEAELCESCKEALMGTILGFMSLALSTAGDGDASKAHSWLQKSSFG